MLLFGKIIEDNLILCVPVTPFDLRLVIRCVNYRSKVLKTVRTLDHVIAYTDRGGIYRVAVHVLRLRHIYFLITIHKRPIHASHETFLVRIRHRDIISIHEQPQSACSWVSRMLSDNMSYPTLNKKV